MPSPRSSAMALARLLNKAAGPVYVVDQDRSLVFVNQALCEWAGMEAEELLGVECSYHSSPQDSQELDIAAALCPPPAVLAGRPASASIVLPHVDNAPPARTVRFLPLLDDDAEVIGIIALAAAEADAETHSAAEDPLADATPHQLHLQLRRLRQQMSRRYGIDRLIGHAPGIRRVRDQVALAAESRASVIILGPPGSGREHVARTIHYAGNPPEDEPLVPLACALLAPELLRSTISALARGDALGPSGRATLLLNEVDRLPAELQHELPRLLTPTLPRVRVLSTATQSPLSLAAEENYHRTLACLLGTIVVELPRLEERIEDIPLLAQLFLEDINARGEKQLAGFTADALDRLVAYPWPGQLDELQQMVDHAHAQATTSEITVADLPPRIQLESEATAHARPPEEPIVLDAFLAEIELELIQRALTQAKGNKTKAASLLGLTRPRLYRRLMQLGLESEAEESK